LYNTSTFTKSIKYVRTHTLYKMIKVTKNFSIKMFFNVFTKKFDFTLYIYCSTVIKNVLYVVVTEGYHTDSIRLIKIDLVRMVEISSHTIDYRLHNETVLKIFGEELYCYTTLIDFDSVDDSNINTNDIYILNLVTLESKEYSIIGFRDIVMINGNICYMENSSDADIKNLNLKESKSINEVFNIVDIETDKKHLTVVEYGRDTYFKDGVLYLDFEINDIYAIFNMGSYIVFRSYPFCNKIVYMDVEKEELIIIDDVDDDHEHMNIGNGKMFVNNTIFDYLNKTEIMTESFFRSSFRYKGNDYYIRPDDEDNMYIDIYVQHVKIAEFDDKIYPEFIIIGTENENMNVSTKLLYDNSKHVQNLLDMPNGQSFKFINNFYCNIGVYIDYIKNRVLKNDSLNALYKISSLLDDFNMESLTYSIIEHIKCTDVNISHAWDFLKVLYVDDTYCVFKTVLYTIYKKYNRDEFMSMLKFTTQMSNDIISELIMDRRVI